MQIHIKSYQIYAKITHLSSSDILNPLHYFVYFPKRENLIQVISINQKQNIYVFVLLQTVDSDRFILHRITNTYILPSERVMNVQFRIQVPCGILEQAYHIVKITTEHSLVLVDKSVIGASRLSNDGSGKHYRLYTVPLPQLFVIFNAISHPAASRSATHLHTSAARRPTSMSRASICLLYFVSMSMSIAD